MEQNQQAIEAFKQSLTLKETWQSYRGLGLALYKNQQYQSAVDALKQSLLSIVLGNSVICKITNDEYQSLVAMGFSQDNIHQLNYEPCLNLLRARIFNVVLYFSDISSVQKVIHSAHKELIAVIDSLYESWQLVKEQVITEDTTASGGNANLLAL